MDFISPFIEPVVSCLVNPLMNHIKYLVKARTNVDDMAGKLETLRAWQRDLHKDIEDAKRRREQGTETANLWLGKVEKLENEVGTIKNEYENRSCRLFGDFSLNCCLTYKCGKRAAKVCEKMVQLKKERDEFPCTTTTQPPGHGQAKPIESTLVGLDLHVETIRKHLTEDAVRIIAIHGMGGVGKTTLLKKVHNSLLQGDNRLGIEYKIWVVVSKEPQLERIQAEVAKSLGLTLNGEDDASGHADTIFNYLEDRSFLLLLDDVWQYIDLVKVGIPDPRPDTSSSNNGATRFRKVILTTRLNKVCRSMGADEIVRVECLKREDARALFVKTLGERRLQSNLAIHGLVEEVINECKGLPLALTVIARAMASKTTIPEWQDAVTHLKRSEESEILDDDDESLNMLPRLKFSYDNLKNDDLRRCFLYCALWPEDYHIWNGNLVRFCIANDVIKGFHSMSEAYDRGHCLIEDLKGACLLEDSSDEYLSFLPQVKMHDVLRDMALWIASDCGENKNKWVVKSGIGLREAPLEAETWKEAHVVSLMNNKIKELPYVTFECPTLSILLLSSTSLTSFMRKIHPSFFQNMCALTYLDLSFTNISELPESITMLARLRCLNLEYTYNLKHTPSGMISSLKELQILYLNGSSVCANLDGVGDASSMENDDGEELEEVSGNGSKGRGRDIMISRRQKSPLEELECLPLPGGLKGLTIDVYSVDVLRRLTILSSRASIWELFLKKIEELTILRLEHNILRSLQVLSLEGCDDVEVLEFESDTCPIEYFVIDGLPKLKEILWRGVAPSVILHRLHWVQIRGCDSLKSISWILRLPSLAVLRVQDCNGLECLVDGEDENSTAVAFPSLKFLILKYLPNLSCICDPQYGLPSLEYLEVKRCPKLKKFPSLSSEESSIGNLRTIEYDDEWWDGLEWDDESIKASLESIRT